MWYVSYFPVPNYKGCKGVLVYPTSLYVEVHLYADGNDNFLSFVLLVFWKDITSLIERMWDTDSVKKYITKNIRCGFMWFVSYRFNFAMKYVLEEYKTHISAVQKKMLKHRSTILASKLRMRTSLKPIKRNMITWSTIYLNIRRYHFPHECVPLMDLPDVFYSTEPHPQPYNWIYFSKVEMLDSVTKLLQSDRTTLAETGGLLDAVMQ